MAARKFTVVGLTGSIGMGKTEVAGMFRSLGVPVFDVDGAVHTLYARGGEAVAPIAAAFPGAVADGAVDRERLAKLVLGDPGRIRQLESIVHPLVRRLQERFIDRARAAGQRLVVLDIPLLFESKNRLADVTVVVSAPADAQRERVLARPNMTEAKFRAILAQQMPDDEKRRRADHVIPTGCSKAETLQAVRDLVTMLTRDTEG